MSEPVSYSFGPTLEPKAARPFAVVIFLPGELHDLVQTMRERYDPDVHLIAPHVSLVFPFSTDLTLPQLSAIIRETIDATGSLEISLESIADLYPTFPIISWAVQHSPKLQELCVRLHASLQLPVLYKGFFPHVGLAKEISDHRIVMVKEKLLEQIEETTFSPAAIDLISPAADSRWLSVRTFVLPQG